MARRPTPALPPLKSCDCSLLFQDNNLSWPFAAAPNLFLMTLWRCSYTYGLLNLPLSRTLSFFLLCFFLLSLSLSCSQTHTPNLYSWQIEIALIEPSMCVDSRDYLDDWSYLWACCFLEKHFELCLWDKADDVTSHIYYFSGAPLIHTNHIYCFCYCHSSLVLFFVQHFNRK